MTSEGSNVSSSSFPLNMSSEISLWLSSLHLPQYATNFAQAGFHTLADCRGLTEEKLQQVAHFPTGHRRRILHNLDALIARDHNDEEGSKVAEEKKNPVPFPRTIFRKDTKGITTSENKQTNSAGENNRLPGTQTLPASTCKKNMLKHDPDFISTVSHTFPRTNHRTSTSGIRSASLASSNELLSASSHSLPSDWENFLQELQPVPGLTDDVSSESCLTRFQGVMVDNDIYESSPFIASGPTSTRSYKLRHRPVPEIPERTVTPPCDSYVVAPYTVLFV